MASDDLRQAAHEIEAYSPLEHLEWRLFLPQALSPGVGFLCVVPLCCCWGVCVRGVPLVPPPPA